jgi:simple sugar transport system permease protein
MNLRDMLTRLGFTALSILLALGITSLLILALGGDPLAVFETTWDGAFGDIKRTASVFNFWIPLTLGAVGLIITFTAGLWNIGVEGQMMMGAVFASYAARTFDLPQPLLIAATVSMAGLGGMLWGVLVGLLKTRAGVHEIFGGVALNALANTFAIYLISGPWQPPEGGSAHSTPPFPEASWLPIISEEFPTNGLMLGITLISIVVVTVLLYGTRPGLQLKAVGKNPRSALLLGIPTERMMLLACAGCGLLAGLAGSYRVLHTYHSLRPLVSGGIGFLGLLIVLLAAFRPVMTPFLTFVLAAIIAGSARVKVLLQLDQSLVGVLQGLLVLAVLLMAGVRERWEFREKHR